MADSWICTECVEVFESRRNCPKCGEPLLDLANDEVATWLGDLDRVAYNRLRGRLLLLFAGLGIGCGFLLQVGAALVWKDSPRLIPALGELMLFFVITGATMCAGVALKVAKALFRPRFRAWSDWVEPTERFSAPVKRYDG